MIDREIDRERFMPKALVFTAFSPLSTTYCARLYQARNVFARLTQEPLPRTLPKRQNARGPKGMDACDRFSCSCAVCRTKKRKRCKYQCFGHGRNMNDVLLPPTKPKQPHVESLADKNGFYPPLFLRFRAETRRWRPSSEEKHGVNYGTVT